MVYVRKNLLSGLLRCPVCGGKMSSAANRWTTTDGASYTSAYYRCKNAWNETGHPCSNKPRYDMVKVDDAIVTFVKNSINKGLFAEKVKAEFAEILDTSNLEKQKSMYKSKLSQVLAGKEQIEKIIDYMPLDIPHRDKKLSDYNKRLDDLYNDIDEIESNIKDLDKKIEGIKNGSKNYDFIMANLEAFETLFDKMDDGEKRKMITMLISEISVDPTSNIINKVKFHFNIESDDENIEFELPIENGPEAIAFREVLNGSKPSKQFMPHYVDEEGHEMVLREVDGKDVLCRKYQKSYHIPKERAHHYNRKQATYQHI